MRNRLTKILAGIAALAALSVGGATLASAGSKTSSPNPPVSAPAQENAAAADTDNLQQGDQTTPDNTAGEKPDSETKDTAEPGSAAESDSATESGSEVQGNDGPGGHADEPGNPNADHQFDGQE